MRLNLMLVYVGHENEHLNNENNTKSFVIFLNMRIFLQVLAWGQDLAFLNSKFKMVSSIKHLWQKCHHFSFWISHMLCEVSSFGWSGILKAVWSYHTVLLSNSHNNCYNSSYKGSVVPVSILAHEGPIELLLNFLLLCAL